MPRHTVKKRSPFAKAIALAIGLVIALYLYHMVKTSNLMEVFLSVFEDTMTTPTNQSKFTNKERDSVVELASGFWVYKSDTADLITIDDRLEITDNGYMWQVEQIQFTLPSGNKKSMTHVFHGFFYPSSKAVPDSTYVNSVIRNLPQMWIDDGDTCVIKKYYGASREHKIDDVVLADHGDFVVADYKDEAIDVFIDGKQLKMNDKDYNPYKKKDIQNFFPKSLIDIVYNLTTADDVKKGKMYTIKDKEVTISKDIKSKGEIEVPTQKECTECFSLKDFLRKAIADDLQKTPVPERNLDEIILIMKKHYIPYCLRAQINFTLYNQDEKSSQINFSFDLTWEGKTGNVNTQIKASAIDRKWKEKEITMEIEKWKFQPLEKESPPFKVLFAEVIE